MMKRTVILVFGSALLATIVRAEVEPAAVSLKKTKAWVGERLSFSVDLRSSGSFGTAASFSLPQVPNVIIMKSGSPVVSSEEIEGESWFIQTHEFALFSQTEGTVEIPAFPVRFGAREGFTGPETEVNAEVPSFTVEIERPPGTEGIGFLITTKSLEINEQWEPNPGEKVETGAVFKRNINQSAENVSGMALSPASSEAPAGVRVYTDQPVITDKIGRGDFSGERTETITYLLEQPGNHTLPEIVYYWWNPDAKAIESKTLPSVTLSAVMPPVKKSPARFLWLLLPLALGWAAWRYCEAILAAILRFRDWIDPPHRRAARHFLWACRRNHPADASRYWSDWHAHFPNFVPGEDLQSGLIELQRQLFGPSPAPENWRGDTLATAFKQRSRTHSSPSLTRPLPPLNP